MRDKKYVTKILLVYPTLISIYIKATQMDGVYILEDWEENEKI